MKINFYVVKIDFFMDCLVLIPTASTIPCANNLVIFCKYNIITMSGYKPLPAGTSIYTAPAGTYGTVGGGFINNVFGSPNTTPQYTAPTTVIRPNGGITQWSNDGSGIHAAYNSETKQWTTFIK